MNDLDERLTDLLARSAAAVPVRHDLDAVLDGEVVVDLDGRRRPRRAALALVAAAVLVVAALAAVVLAATGDGTPEGVTDVPPPPAERFPVLDVVPPALDGPVVARGGPLGDVSLQHLSLFSEDVPIVRAVVGLVGDDDTVRNAAVLQAVPGELPVVFLEGAEPVTIAGRDAYRRVDGTTGTTEVVVLGDGASLLAKGPRGTDELLDRTEDLVVAVEGGRPVLGLGGLPAGFEVLLPPGPDESGTGVEVAVGPEGDPDVMVSTGSDDPLAMLAAAADVLEPVDVGGVRGWRAEPEPGYVYLSWRGPGEVALLLQGHLSPADALRIARGVRLVDEEAWLEAYGAGPVPTAGEAETTSPAVDPIDHPLVGQPLPEIPGIGAEEREGRSAVVALVADEGCSACTRAVAELADLARRTSDPFTLVLDADAIRHGDGVVAAADGLDVLSMVDVDQALLDAWSVTELPTTVVAGPDGIVRLVLTGPVTRTGLEIALDAARTEAEGG